MDIFNFIKSHVQIWDVVNDYTTLKKAGSYWKTRCPFHHENTGSFTVSPEKGIFYCFGCHKTGDVITFITLAENCSPAEAVEHLAQKYHLTLPQEGKRESSRSPSHKKKHTQVCQAVALWCHAYLKKNRDVAGALLERGFTPQTIEQFSIGYFPGGVPQRNLLLSYLREHNLLAQDLVDAQIFYQSSRSLYSPFEERILFPIKDMLGRFCGFGGRIFRPNDQRPKYVNSRETDYFVKGNLLFGFDVAKPNIQEKKAVFLVEGYTDCIAMAQHGFSNTVATLGTACTLSQLKTLSRFAAQLFVLYDADAAGQKAILRLTDLCWQANMELQVVALPSGHDPASFLQSGQDPSPLIKNSKDIFMFFIEAMSANFHQKRLGEKVTDLRKLLGVVQGISDPLKQDLLLQRAGALLQVPIESLKAELKRSTQLKARRKGEKTLGSEGYEGSEQPPAATDPEGSDFTLEKRAFCAILNHTVDPQAHWSESEHDAVIHTLSCAAQLLPKQLSQILARLRQHHEGKPKVTFDSFFATLEEPEQRLISSLLLKHDQEHDLHLIRQLVGQLYKKRWRKVVQEVQIQVAQERKAGNVQKVQALIDEFLQTKQQIKNYLLEQGSH